MQLLLASLSATYPTPTGGAAQLCPLLLDHVCVPCTCVWLIGFPRGALPCFTASFQRGRPHPRQLWGAHEGVCSVRLTFAIQHY